MYIRFPQWFVLAIIHRIYITGKKCEDASMYQTVVIINKQKKYAIIWRNFLDMFSSKLAILFWNNIALPRMQNILISHRIHQLLNVDCFSTFSRNTLFAWIPFRIQTISMNSNCNWKFIYFPRTIFQWSLFSFITIIIILLYNWQI